MPLTAAMSEGFHEAGRAVPICPAHFFFVNGWAHPAAAERDDQAVQYEGSDEFPDHGRVVMQKSLRSDGAKEPVRE